MGVVDPEYKPPRARLFLLGCHPVEQPVPAHRADRILGARDDEAAAGRLVAVQPAVPQRLSIHEHYKGDESADRPMHAWRSWGPSITCARPIRRRRLLPTPSSRASHQMSVTMGRSKGEGRQAARSGRASSATATRFPTLADRLNCDRAHKNSYVLHLRSIPKLPCEIDA
jgi:hypothetical protein